MNSPTPLPLTSGLNKQEIGGGSLAAVPPDRYPDHADSGQDRFLIIRWQDDRNGRWSKEHLISLGSTGQERMDRMIAPMGTYRARQFEFVLPASCVCMICSVEDDTEVIE